MAETQKGQFPPIDKVEINENEIAQFTKEHEYTSLSFELLREVAGYVCIAANIMGPSPTWDRDQAVLGGSMVRLYKLYHGLLDQAAQDRREIFSILSRLTFESLVTVRFFIKFFSADLVQSYMRHSLKHERRLRDKIQANIAARDGEMLAIEARMLASIERSAQTSGISLDDVDLKGRDWGNKNMREKADAVGLGEAYLAAFGGMSHSVHGSWQDLLEYQLASLEDGRFEPEFAWHSVRPQVLHALGLLTIDTVSNYLDYLAEQGRMEDLSEKLSSLRNRILVVNDAHEKFLNSRP
jgi:hypothetical protein